MWKTLKDLGIVIDNQKKYDDYTWVEKKETKPYDRKKLDELFNKIEKESITIDRVLEKFKPEELIDAIGVEQWHLF